MSGVGLEHFQDGLALQAGERQVEIVAVGVFDLQTALAVGDLKLSFWPDAGRRVSVMVHWFG